MKTFILITAIILAACEPSYQEKTDLKLPEGLQDCKFYELSDSQARRIQVVRCPSSQTSTTHKSGKKDVLSHVIESENRCKS